MNEDKKLAISEWYVGTPPREDGVSILVLVNKDYAIMSWDDQEGQWLSCRIEKCGDDHEPYYNSAGRKDPLIWARIIEFENYATSEWKYGGALRDGSYLLAIFEDYDKPTVICWMKDWRGIESYCINGDKSSCCDKEPIKWTKINY